MGPGYELGKNSIWIDEFCVDRMRDGEFLDDEIDDDESYDESELYEYLDRELSNKLRRRE